MPEVENETPVNSLSELGDKILTPQQKAFIEAARKKAQDEFDEMLEGHDGDLDYMHRYGARREPEEPWPPIAATSWQIKKKEQGS